MAAVLGERYGTTPVRLATALVLPTATVTMLVAMRAIYAKREVDVRRIPWESGCGSGVGSGTAVDIGTLPEPATLDVSVVIPSFNGGARLVPFVDALCHAMNETRWTHEVVISVDGSTDGSDRAVEALHPGVVVVRSETNMGKGAALRTGFAHTRGASVGFIDGDGDIAPGVIIQLVRALGESRSWVAVATKNHPAAIVSATTVRRAMSAVYRFVVHWMFDLDVTDTQCGCKVFRREFLAATLGHTHEDGFALDLELLMIGSRLGMRLNRCTSTAAPQPLHLNRCTEPRSPRT